MNTPIRLSDDEMRLVQLFRALQDDRERSLLLQRLGQELLAARYPGRTIYDFMPEAWGSAAGVSATDPGPAAHAIRTGLEATGNPLSILLGSSSWDDAAAVPEVTMAAGLAAQARGDVFEEDESAVREYLEAWRWQLIWAIRQQKRGPAPAA